MLTSKLTKKIFTFLAVMIVAVMGMFFAKNQGQASLNFPVKTPTQWLTEQNNLPLMLIPGDRACISLDIYTSFPPKCRTFDGTFIQVGELPSNVFLIPKGK